MTQEQIVEAYRRALALTEEMFDAAHAGDWDRLVATERDRDRLVEAIRERDADPPKSGELRQRIRDLIEQILARDEEIRSLTQDWMHELREILANTETAQRLNKTYSQR